MVMELLKQKSVFVGNFKIKEPGPLFGRINPVVVEILKELYVPGANNTVSITMLRSNPRYALTGEPTPKKFATHILGDSTHSNTVLDGINVSDDEMDLFACSAICGALNDITKIKLKQRNNNE